MKTLQLLACLALMGVYQANAQTSNKKAKTYAEISVKEGGKWEGRRIHRWYIQKCSKIKTSS